jgi:hypothetical protein
MGKVVGVWISWPFIRRGTVMGLVVVDIFVVVGVC